MSADNASIPMESLSASPQFETEMHPKTQVAFLLPYLRAGMRILDCGCGMGDQTIELARWAEPGSATGIDIEPRQIEQARVRAGEQLVENAYFETGSVLEIPFESESFDLVFCNGVLCQLRDPAAALKEMARVVRPGGVVAAREPDFETSIWHPMSLPMQQAYTLQLRAIEELGGNFCIGRKLRDLFSEAGMAYSEGSASCNSYGTPGAVEALTRYLVSAWQSSAWSDLVRDREWADEVTIASFQQAAEDFASEPNAFLAVTWCEALSVVY